MPTVPVGPAPIVESEATQTFREAVRPREPWPPYDPRRDAQAALSGAAGQAANDIRKWFGGR